MTPSQGGGHHRNQGTLHVQVLYEMCTHRCQHSLHVRSKGAHCTVYACHHAGSKLGWPRGAHKPGQRRPQPPIRLVAQRARLSTQPHSQHVQIAQTIELTAGVVTTPVPSLPDAPNPTRSPHKGPSLLNQVTPEPPRHLHALCGWKACLVQGSHIDTHSQKH